MDGHRAGGEGGYTLLEVVVALTLLSILAVVLSGSLSFGSRVWEHTSSAVRASGDTISAYQFLNVTLTHIGLGLHNTSTGEDEQRPPLVGTSSSVEFLAGDLATVGLSGLHRITISLMGSNMVAVVDADGTASGDSQRFVLTTGVTALSLSYRGYGNDNLDTGWTDEWSNPQRGPLMVRLHAERTVGHGIEWVFRLPEPIH